MELNISELNGMSLNFVLNKFEALGFELLGTETLNEEIELETFDSCRGFGLLMDYHYSDGCCFNFRITWK